MKKLIAITTAVLTVALCTTGCATKSRTVDIRGMFVSESGQLAIGYAHVDAIPEGTESAVIHYKEDVALLSPSKKTHDIDVTLTGTNAVSSAGGIVKSICEAFIAVAPSIAKTNAEVAAKGATSPIDLAKANADNATAAKLAKAEAKQTTESAEPSSGESSSGEPLQGDADCANGACEDK